VGRPPESPPHQPVAGLCYSIRAVPGADAESNVSLYIDGKVVGEGRIERTTPMPFSGDESLDLGDELGSPVTTDYGERKFTGTVNWVEIDVGMDDHNHLISPEERLNLALAFH
jgi:hypothetical protein